MGDDQAHVTGLLINAVDLGNCGEVERLVKEEGVDVNARTVGGLAPLHFARTAAVAEALLRLGADVNARATLGNTALHWLSDAPLAQVLLEHGAAVNAVDADGETPLHGARNAEMVGVLLSFGGDVRAKDSKGRTPLQRACSAAVSKALQRPELQTETGRWLQGQGLHKYAGLFWEQGLLRLALCRELTEEQLRVQLGVTAVGDRKRLAAMGKAPQLRKSSSGGLSGFLTRVSKRVSLSPSPSPGASSGNRKSSRHEHRHRSHSSHHHPDVFKYDFFLTHAWGHDKLGRDNHARVSQLNARLRALGARTWFDEDRLEGAVWHEMARGVRASRLILVCITERYMTKVDKPNDDNCKYEFVAAKIARGSQNMVPVVLEPSMRTIQGNWIGPLAGTLGDRLFHDFADDDAIDKVANDLIAVLNKHKHLHLHDPDHAAAAKQA